LKIQIFEEKKNLFKKNSFTQTKEIWKILMISPASETRRFLKNRPIFGKVAKVVGET
jgi:hypothetical protein